MMSASTHYFLGSVVLVVILAFFVDRLRHKVKDLEKVMAYVDLKQYKR